jgi:hypothetical protein
MNRITFWNNDHESGRPIPGRRSGDTTDSQTLDTLPVYVTAEQLEVKTLLAPASRLSRFKARLQAALKPTMSKQAIKQEKEALGTWEDEGGKAAVKKPSTTSAR